MKYILSIIVLLISGCVYSDKSPIFNNPEIGIWKTESGEHCSEVITFNTNGTFNVVSGEQRVTEKYQLTLLENNFYELFYETIKYNGKPSCMGRIDAKIGEKIVVYLQFNKELNHIKVYFLPKESEYLDLTLIKIQ